MDKHSVAYDWCYPADGDSFPAIEAYSGVISFGGASSANDCQTLPWVKSELDFIEQCLAHERGFFGICLGAQLLARVLGSTVSAHPSAVREVGYTLVEPTADSGDFLTTPMKVMQWHGEGFELPQGSTLVATGEEFPNQAFRYTDRVYGVQFHPEVNPQALAIWHERNKKRETGVLTDAERSLQMQDALAHDEDITRWLGGFLQKWCESS